MNRNDFLKLIGSSGTSFLLSGFVGKDLLYNLQEITIYDNYVRGTNFYRDEFRKLKLQIGQTIELKREPDNQHDKFAIGVLTNKVKIGYIPAYENVVLANMMDKGVTLVATVSELNELDEEDYIRDAVAVKITTRLMVPVQQFSSTDLTHGRADNALDVYRRGPFGDD